MHPFWCPFCHWNFTQPSQIYWVGNAQIVKMAGVRGAAAPAPPTSITHGHTASHQEPHLQPGSRAAVLRCPPRCTMAPGCSPPFLAAGVARSCGQARNSPSETTPQLLGAVAVVPASPCSPPHRVLQCCPPAQPRRSACLDATWGVVQQWPVCGDGSGARHSWAGVLAGLLLLWSPSPAPAQPPAA